MPPGFPSGFPAGGAPVTNLEHDEDEARFTPAAPSVETPRPAPIFSQANLDDNPIMKRLKEAQQKALVTYQVKGESK
jgi:hypothetical protein